MGRHFGGYGGRLYRRTGFSRACSARQHAIYRSAIRRSHRRRPRRPGGTAQRLTQDRDIPGEWWGLFHSPQITELVTQALQANPDVAAAQATLRQARETTRAEQGALFPQVSASLQAQRQQQSLAAFGLGNGSSTFSLETGSLNVSYTLDAFGGIRRQIEQLNAQAEYQRFELEATDLTLAANVINAAITEASLQAQIDTTQDIINADTRRAESGPAALSAWRRQPG